MRAMSHVLSRTTLVTGLCSMQVLLSVEMHIGGAVEMQLLLMIAAAVREPTARSPFYRVLTFILVPPIKLFVTKRILVRLAKTGEILRVPLSV